MFIAVLANTPMVLAILPRTMALVTVGPSASRGFTVISNTDSTVTVCTGATLVDTDLSFTLAVFAVFPSTRGDCRRIIIERGNEVPTGRITTIVQARPVAELGAERTTACCACRSRGSSLSEGDARIFSAVCSPWPRWKVYSPGHSGRVGNTCFLQWVWVIRDDYRWQPNARNQGPNKVGRILVSNIPVIEAMLA